eukprot:TRINITY_DN45437_c0_g1_i1.p1 TRINITY_DN45437_c0_g1~~TRINITY_DN45437_c0_g1_i1.p1  ORF type:complete len:384 (-),score=112.24 TRINITY_DN45437_c0_g1_i1:163-1314(-)
MAGNSEGAGGYHIYVYGKHKDPLFQKYRVAAESLAEENRNVEATIEGFFETQYEQQLRQLIATYGASFAQCKPNAPIIFAETEESILYFATEQRFFDWALKRFKYEDHTRLFFYRRVAQKAFQQAQERSGRSYCSMAFSVAEEDEAKQSRMEESATDVCVTGIPGETPDEEALRKSLSQFGVIASLEFKFDASDKFLGCCMVSFEEAMAAQAAIANSGNLEVDGKPLTVQAAVAAEETVVFELFNEDCPELVKHFLAMHQHSSFNGHPVHRVKAGSWIQAGDLVDGSGAHSTYCVQGAEWSELHRHESYVHRHDRAGLLGLCCHGEDTAGSQFYVTLRELPMLDGRFVAIGRVISGMRTVLKIGKVSTKNERPIKDVKVYARG